MATLPYILANLQSTEESNVNENSLIELMKQISGNPSDMIDPADDPDSLYGQIVTMYNEMVAARGNDGDITAALDKIQNLTASATQVPYTDPATATLVDSDIQMEIPQGTPGENGLTPVLEFSYNGTTGNLEVEVVNYTDTAEVVAEEW